MAGKVNGPRAFHAAGFGGAGLGHALNHLLFFR
jgi:hypothetical protein